MTIFTDHLQKVYWCGVSNDEMSNCIFNLINAGSRGQERFERFHAIHCVVHIV